MKSGFDKYYNEASSPISSDQQLNALLIDLQAFQQYDMETRGFAIGATMSKDADGDWVKFDDIVEIISKYSRA